MDLNSDLAKLCQVETKKIKIILKNSQRGFLGKYLKKKVKFFWSKILTKKLKPKDLGKKCFAINKIEDIDYLNEFELEPVYDTMNIHIIKEFDYGEAF